MRIRVYVKTDKTGSECEDEFEIADEELAGMTPEERDEYIEEQARDCALNWVEWWHEEVES